ncbi:glycosyltransferase family 4 protein [Mucilaginibacter sp.]|uniref:glycosyltransferase family 4 protein n=1 Tax=Mucilaginibacter sp. TaxID=1882438 RepID=UPI0026209516|nr:glycosyltransferase family 4 protein [Mucilaginibacter sp.]MDB4927010.1 glycosyltransferase family 4 protein [Mucilaginibacter sp.]
MNIAITADPVIPVPPKLYGGIERIIDLLINGLVKQGHTVTLFAHKDSKVMCKLVPYKTTGNGIKDNISNALIINKTLLSNKFDIVHSFGRLGYLLPQMPLSVPKLMSYQREPTISQIKKAVKLCAKDTLAFTGCSNYITDKLKPFAQAYTVYNGIDISKYHASATVNTGAPLVFLGRIEAIKGTHTAIEIAQKTNRKLIIAGNIPAQEQDYFDTQIKPSLNEQITYIGAVDDIQKNELLQNASALLMPIHWNEPFGIVMIEAMACGTPVIGFNRGAVPEVIENGITGYYAETTHELMEKINLIHLLNRKRIREITEERFSAAVIVARYLHIYKQIIRTNENCCL